MCCRVYWVGNYYKQHSFSVPEEKIWTAKGVNNSGLVGFDGLLCAEFTLLLSSESILLLTLLFYFPSLIRTERMEKSVVIGLK